MIVDINEIENELLKRIKSIVKISPLLAQKLMEADCLNDVLNSKLDEIINEIKTGIVCPKDTLKYIAIIVGSINQSSMEKSFARGFNLAKLKTSIKVNESEIDKNLKSQVYDLVLSATPWDEDKELQNIQLRGEYDVDSIAEHIEPFGNKAIIEYQKQLSKRK